MTPEIRRELGFKRAEVSHLIKHLMRLNGYTEPRLAKELGCSTNNVSRVITGNGHSEMVLNALREIGVPEQYLFDPRRVELPKLKK